MRSKEVSSKRPDGGLSLAMDSLKLEKGDHSWINGMLVDILGSRESRMVQEGPSGVLGCLRGILSVSVGIRRAKVLESDQRSSR